MPSHDIHRLFAMKYLGISGYVATEVDRLIDLGPLRDVGRRIPKEPPAYLDIVEQGDIEKMYKMKLKEKIKNTLIEICRDNIKTKVFFFHHALDILAIRLASAIMLDLEPEKICNDLVKGTLYDLLEIELNLRKIGIPCFNDFKEEIGVALHSSCVDRALIKWVEDNIVPRYKSYKSLDYIKERYRSIISVVSKSDAKYEVGFSLGLISYITSMPKINPHRRVKAEFIIGGKEIKIPNNELIDREGVDAEYKGVLRRRLHSPALSPYGLGRLRRIIVNLASLYSDLYHLPFIEPYYLKVTVKEILSARKKKYTLASNVLKCYSRCLNNPLKARDCAVCEIDLILKSYTKVIDKQRLENMKNKFIEALEELLKFSNNLGIDILSDL